MIVDAHGANAWPENAKSSTETPIHTAIYDLFDAGAVLHTHSVGATAFSLRHAKAGSVAFAGLELLKGLAGITTHETSIDVPIFANDQDMARFSAMIREALRGRQVYGFLIAGHGLYTWGATLRDARRHLEVFEFLFDLSSRMETHLGSIDGG
jgi:methylthioribulose-1-phosphate dehydratase